jgi:formate dehydrogenase subunit gamma
MTEPQRQLPDQVVRFSPGQRAEHAAAIFLFAVLALTGFPQKFYDSSWAGPLLSLFGGLARARAFHRLAGIAFSALAVGHMATVLILFVTRRCGPTMIPTRKDFEDVVLTLRHDLGLTEERPRFDRYDYREKFEYWGLVLGGVVMMSTGFLLYLPTLATRLLPGELIPVAKVAHSNEGLMAFLVVLTWHMYNAHLAPQVFPFNNSIFSGRISREKLAHEHPLEHERLFPGAATTPAPSPAPVERRPETGTESSSR